MSTRSEKLSPNCLQAINYAKHLRRVNKFTKSSNCMNIYDILCHRIYENIFTAPDGCHKS